MRRPSAMFLAGLFSTLFIIGSVFMAFQAGMFASATTTVQVNGDINVPEVKSKPTQANAAPEIVFVTRTQIIRPDPIVQTVYVTVTESNHQREAELLAQLNEAYRLLQERDAVYQAKLKEAYERAQAGAAKTAITAPAASLVVLDTHASVISATTTGLPGAPGQTSGVQPGSGQTSSGQTNTGRTGGTTQTSPTTSTLQIVAVKPVTRTHEADLRDGIYHVSAVSGTITDTVSSHPNIHDALSHYTNTQSSISSQFINLGYKNGGAGIDRTINPTDTTIITSTNPITVDTVPTGTGVLIDPDRAVPTETTIITNSITVVTVPTGTGVLVDPGKAVPTPTVVTATATNPDTSNKKNVNKVQDKKTDKTDHSKSSGSTPQNAAASQSNSNAAAQQAQKPDQQSDSGNTVAQQAQKPDQQSDSSNTAAQQAQKPDQKKDEHPPQDQQSGHPSDKDDKQDNDHGKDKHRNKGKDD